MWTGTDQGDAFSQTSHVLLVRGCIFQDEERLEETCFHNLRGGVNVERPTGASTIRRCLPTRIFLFVKCRDCVVGVAELMELEAPTGKALQPARMFAIDD